MTDKRYLCTDCSKRFSKKEGRKQHWRDTSCEFGNGTTIESNHPIARQARDEDWQKDLADMDASTRRDVFESVVDDDLPDGAYFAMAQEFGLEPVDLIDEEDL